MNKKSSSCSFSHVITIVVVIIITIIIIIISLCHDGVTLLANYGPNSVLNLEGFVYTVLNELRYICVYSIDIPHVAKSTIRQRQITR